MSIARHHAEWLNLVPASGPFLSMNVLGDVFPDGLDKLEDEPERRARLRVAYEEWLDNQGGLQPDVAIHQAWIRFVLREALDLDEEALAEGQSIPEGLALRIPEHGETIRPDLALITPKGRSDADAVRMLVHVLPPSQKLESALAGARWKASPATRMMSLLHGASIKLGLVTNGEHWMLVHAIPGETTTYASFYAGLFSEEPLTLRAFASLLSSHRFFGVPGEDVTKKAEDEKGQTLEALFKRSAKNQADVTDQLGAQVRRAVEQLIQSIDRLDRDQGRELLKGFDEQRLYEAAVTLMMRLVFLLAAEERKLLPLGQQLYDQHYAISTLRDQLQEVADRHGDEVLSRRFDAWSRLLATFRAVYAGVRHEDLKLPAYGGSLFDPDRFPFLEGRPAGSSWHDTPARPLAIDNLTVLDVLSSIQILGVKVKGGGPAEARRLSFRALDVEQIGHVYEGLLDHTAKRAKGPVVSLRGAKNKEPEVEVAELDRLRADGDAKLLEWLQKETGRSQSALQKSVAYELPRDDHRKWMLACDNKEQLYERVLPYAGLVREDVHHHPVVFDAGAVYVTEGQERRATGTHYTPRSLTEPIVQYTLEPLVYEGPAEGWEKEKWRLRSAKEILDLKVCDMAMGSGAFLVQACRYMAERVVEAWDEAERKANGRLVIAPNGDFGEGNPSERNVPTDPEERLAIARRFVADRCLYGVDKNPMAVEMAKLSLWLVTLQKDKPFTFVDHALRCGDSLLGLTSIDQLTSFHLDPKRGKKLHATMVGFTKPIEESVRRARELREKISSFAVNGIDDARKKEWMLEQADRELEHLRIVADLVIGAALATAGKSESALNEELQRLSLLLPGLLVERDLAGRERAATDLRGAAERLIDSGREPQHADRRTFHWALEFPEALGARGGFDAFIGNPPFMLGSLISTRLGDAVAAFIRTGRFVVSGKVDFCVYFLRSAAALLADTGCLGVILTAKANEGSSQRDGLSKLASQGWSRRFSAENIVWPGSAGVLVSLFSFGRGSEGEITIEERLARERLPLVRNDGSVYLGAKPDSLGFIVDPKRASELLRSGQANGIVLRPYYSGDDINGLSAIAAARRFIVDFSDMGLEEASRFEELFCQVRRDVRPGRLKLKRKAYRERWWQFTEPQSALFRAIRRDPATMCIAMSRISTHFTPRWAPTHAVYSDKVIVFTGQTDWHYGVLSSSVHREWGFANSGTHGSGSARYRNYKPTDCGRTFPWPANSNESAIAAISRTLRMHQDAMYSDLGGGPTLADCRLADATETLPVVLTVREVVVGLDEAVAAAYGWTDLDLGHRIRDTKQGVRFTISDAARREVLRRLLALNHERYAEEVRQGLHDKKKPKGAKKGKSAARSRPPAATTSSRPRKSGPVQIGFDLGEPPPPQIGLDFDADPVADEPHEHLSADAAALLGAIRDRPEPVGKSELLDAAGIAPSKWTAAISELKDRGLVEQIGERRGARYAAKGQS